MTNKDLEAAEKTAIGMMGGGLVMDLVDEVRRRERRARLQGLREAQKIASLYNCAGQDEEATKIQDHLDAVIRRVEARARGARKKR